MSKACGKLDQLGAAEIRSDGMYPARLNKIINLFETLPEDERRETLVSYADNAKKQEPRTGETFDLVDVRKDAVQLAAHPLLVLGAQLEPGEARHVLDLLEGDPRLRHG